MSIALSLPQLGLSVAAGGLPTLSPCVFPLLPLVLGGVVLALFGMGAPIPLVAVAYVSRSDFMHARDWIRARIERVRRGFAVLFGGMSIAILTGVDKWVEARVMAWLPDAWVNLTIGI